MRDKGKKFILSMALFPFSVVIHGLVLVKLWEMFVSATFDIASISIAQAAGLMLVIEFIILKVEWSPYMDETDFKEFTEKYVAHALITPFAILFLGYIINMFI
jgi:hypothetical protein